jgi:purine-binding chemotaxis protein CheW
MSNEPLEKAANADLAGKYLTFRLSHEEYGIGILKVVEIIKLMEITEVPRTPDFTAESSTCAAK